jgi:hypothetical protein
MRPWAKATVVFSGTLWILVVVAGAVSVYGFDQYERAWGRGGSFQVYTWIAFGMAALAAVCAGIGFSFGGLNRRVPGVPITVLVVLASLGATLGLLYFLAPKSLDANLPWFAICLAVCITGLTFASCFVPQPPPNKSLERMHDT